MVQSDSLNSLFWPCWILRVHLLYPRATNTSRWRPTFVWWQTQSTLHGHPQWRIFFLGGGDSLMGNEKSPDQNWGQSASHCWRPVEDSVTEDEEFPNNGRCHSSSFDCVNWEFGEEEVKVWVWNEFWPEIWDELNALS